MPSVWDPRGSMIKSNMGMINTPGPVRPSDSDDLETLALLTLGGKLYDSADKAGYPAKAVNAVKYGVSDTFDFLNPFGKYGGSLDAFQGNYMGIQGDIDSDREMDEAKKLLISSKDPERIKTLTKMIEEGERKRSEWERSKRR